MDDGAKHHVVCKGPKGTWGMPPLEDADHRVKLEDCFSRVLRDAKVDTLLAQLDRIEKQSAEGVLGILKMIAGKKTPSRSKRK